MSDLDTLKAVLETAGVKRVYKANEVPAKTPGMYPYAVISSAPGAPQVRSLDGSGDRIGRFVVQHFAQTHDMLTLIADLSFAAFDGKTLPLDGEPVCWQEIASPAYRDPDDNGVLTITHTYRF